MIIPSLAPCRAMSRTVAQLADLLALLAGENVAPLAAIGLACLTCLRNLTCFAQRLTRDPEIIGRKVMRKAGRGKMPTIGALTREAP